MAEHWDVRTTVGDPDVADPKIQKSYDTINLMAFVFKEIPFHTMYEKPLRELCPEDLLPKLKEAHRIGLMPAVDPTFPTTNSLLERLNALNSNLSIYGLFTDPNLPPEIVELLPAIKASGLCTPFVDPSDEDRARWKSGLDTLLGCDARDLSYYDVYTKSKNDTAPDVVSAIEQASEAGVLNKLSNDKVWMVDDCYAQEQKFCNDALTGGPSLACSRPSAS